MGTVHQLRRQPRLPEAIEAPAPSQQPTPYPGMAALLLQCLWRATLHLLATYGLASALAESDMLVGWVGSIPL